MTAKPSLAEAYASCLKLAQSHYENFPVASLFLPKRLRQPISVIYAFARSADDFADEGHATQAVRLQQLNHYSQWLTEIEAGSYHGQDPIFIALGDVISRHDLPIRLFHDLLTAFKQDVVKTRYVNFDEVLEYCRYSANPVGRLLLYLEGKPTQTQLQQSDAICSALQLINFYQDIEQDFTEQDRIYIPQDELAAAGLSERDLIKADTRKAAPLIRSLYRRAEKLMLRGYPLGATLPGRLGWEVRAMTLGGVRTLAELKSQTDNSLLSRPRLSKKKLLGILLSSMTKSAYIRRCKYLLKHG